MTPQDIADVLNAAGFTKVTLAAFVANSQKPVQTAQLQDQIRAVQATLAGQQADASQKVNAIQAQIAALG